MVRGDVQVNNASVIPFLTNHISLSHVSRSQDTQNTDCTVCVCGVGFDQRGILGRQMLTLEWQQH